MVIWLIMADEDEDPSLVEKKHLHALIPMSTFRDLRQLSIKFGSITKVIEHAVSILKIIEHDVNSISKPNLLPFQLWHLMRSDFNMMAVGRKTFLSYIHNLPKEPLRENNAIELIEWYYNKSINELSLLQILEAIKGIWIAGNYFRSIIIQPDSVQAQNASPKYRVIFNHDFNDNKYSLYWSEYFKAVLESAPLNYKVLKSDVRNQLFRIEVTQ